MEQYIEVKGESLINAINYCKRGCLFFGEGNPYSKILIVGKEIGGNDDDKVRNSADVYLRRSYVDVRRNIEKWANVLGYPLSEISSYVFNHERNPTWTNYQKLVGRIIGRDLGCANYDFLKYCFITEMSDVHLPFSNYPKSLPHSERIKLEHLRQDSIGRRTELFRMEFFLKFPIVIMACGHYPRKFNFDIESIFNVEWDGTTHVLSKGNFYNAHNASNKILIHTRQMSRGVTKALINDIGTLCNSAFEFDI